jgi:hypothetical protein
MRLSYFTLLLNCTHEHSVLRCICRHVVMTALRAKHAQLPAVHHQRLATSHIPLVFATKISSSYIWLLLPRTSRLS